MLRVPLHVWALLAGVLAPAAGLIAVALLVPDTLHSVSSRPVPVTMPVTFTRDTKAQAVQASLSWRSGPSLLAPAWSGLVTAVEVASGSSITSGTSLATIDGVERIALTSSRPFYRSIGPGVSGSDVVDLRGALARLKIGPVGSGATYDVTLHDAIKHLQARLTGASVSKASGVFDPAWVVFLPTSRLVSSTVNLTVGSAAPPSGQVIVGTTPQLNPVSLSASSSDGSASLPADSTGYVLDLADGTVVPTDRGFGVNDRTSLDVLAKALGPSATQLSGQVHLAQPQSLATVPSTAVVSDAAGNYCVFVSVAGRLNAIVVRPAGGLPGETEVAALPASVQTIVANPAQVAAGRSCV
jgi:hypothetical protein